MSVFSGPPADPMVAGRALCVVGADGQGWVRQQCDADVPADTLALLAATTFMLRGAKVRALWRLPVGPWLEATRMAASDPEDFNQTMNSAGVTPIGQAGTPAGACMLGLFSILPTGHLTGEWDPLPTFTDLPLASRMFGVLAAAALWCDVEDALEHVARTLETIADKLDFTQPSLMDRLPQRLITDARDRAARNRSRAVRSWWRNPGATSAR